MSESSGAVAESPLFLVSDWVVATRQWQPSFIENSSIEVSEMAFEADATLGQCVEDCA